VTERLHKLYSSPNNIFIINSQGVAGRENVGNKYDYNILYLKQRGHLEYLKPTRNDIIKMNIGGYGYANCIKLA
jgi:hypothetical protein